MAINCSYLVHETVQERSWLKEAAVILGASLIIALFAPAAIHLPFTVVPIGTQAHVILMLACFLGSKRASLAVLAFLGQGAMGLPVFAGGAGGILALAGPRGGYLLGYLVAAFVTGLIMENTSKRTATKAFIAMGLGNLVIYCFGLPWLSCFIGWQNVFLHGMLPFLFGDLIKLVVATKSLKALRFYS